MAPVRFAEGIVAGTPIRVHNFGRMRRDFTYIDDIVEGVMRVLDRPARPDPAWHGDAPDPATSKAPYRLYNIGGTQPLELMRFIGELERCLGRKAIVELVPMEAGEVEETMADGDLLESAVGFQPRTPIEVGIERFVAWYRRFYRIAT